MAHLASGPGFSLAIEMQDRIRFSGEFGGPADVGADQVFHHAIGVTSGISERQAGDCPNMLLELGYGACRFCPVTRIMNPRGNFVDEKAVPVTFADGEELNREDADIVQVPGDRRGNLQRLGLHFRSEAGGNGRGVEDVIAVYILSDVIGRTSPDRPRAATTETSHSK
jgi:hypothetical protein